MKKVFRNITLLILVLGFSSCLSLLLYDHIYSSEDISSFSIYESGIQFSINNVSYNDILNSFNDYDYLASTTTQSYINYAPPYSQNQFNSFSLANFYDKDIAKSYNYSSDGIHQGVTESIIEWIDAPVDVIQRDGDFPGKMLERLEEWGMQKFTPSVCILIENMDTNMRHGIAIPFIVTDAGNKIVNNDDFENIRSENIYFEPDVSNFDLSLIPGKYSVRIFSVQCIMVGPYGFNSNIDVYNIVHKDNSFTLDIIEGEYSHLMLKTISEGFINVTIED